MSRKKRAAPPPSEPLLARSPDPVAVSRPLRDLTEGPEPILIALELAVDLGHKTDRRGIRVILCWHCEMSGMLLLTGERTGDIFTDRCPGIVRRGA